MGNVVPLSEHRQDTLPALVDKLWAHIREAKNQVEVLATRDEASATLAAVRKIKGVSLEAQGELVLIIDQCDKRLGQELLGARERGEIADKGGRPKTSTPGEPVLPNAQDLGLSKKDAAYAVQRAGVPDEVAQKAVKENVAKGKEPTKAAVQRAVKEARRPKSAVTPETQQVREAIARRKAEGAPVTPKALHEATGISAPVIRKAIAIEETEAKVLEAPLPDFGLAPSAQQKLEAAIRAHKKKLDFEFEERVRQASLKWVHETRIPIYEKKLDAIERMLSWPRNSVMTKAEYKKVLMCLHPDGLASRTEEQLAEAFRIFTHYKAKMVLLDPDERAQELSGLPRTLDELLARKKQR